MFRSPGEISVLRCAGPTGLGSAYRAGFTLGLDRGSDVLVEAGADLSHDPNVVPAVLEAVEQGADLGVRAAVHPA